MNTSDKYFNLWESDNGTISADSLLGDWSYSINQYNRHCMCLTIDHEGLGYDSKYLHYGSIDQCKAFAELVECEFDAHITNDMLVRPIAPIVAVDVGSVEEWSYNDNIQVMQCSPEPGIHYFFYGDLGDDSKGLIEKRILGDEVSINFYIGINISFESGLVIMGNDWDTHVNKKGFYKSLGCVVVGLVFSTFKSCKRNIKKWYKS